MKFSTATIALLATSVAASPITAREEDHHLNVEPSLKLDTRAYTSISELDNGGCRPYIFFFARGTNQAGNVVSSTMSCPKGNSLCTDTL